MKQRVKQVMAVFLVVFVLAGMVNPSVVYAQNTSVTETVSKTQKKNLTSLCQEFTTFCGVQYTNMKIGESKVYQFKKESARKAFLPYYTNYDEGMEKGSINVFGVKTNVSEIEQLEGDWGTAAPQIRVKKIAKTGDNTYRVTCTLYWHDYEQNQEKKMGNLSFAVVKNAKTQYGFAVTKLKFTKTQKVY